VAKRLSDQNGKAPKHPHIGNMGMFRQRRQARPACAADVWGFAQPADLYRVGRICLSYRVQDVMVELADVAEPSWKVYLCPV
jgi:hypothetical protein